MVEDLHNSLQQLCSFLGVRDICTKQRIECVVNNSEGNFKRKKPKNERSPYPKKILKLIQHSILEVFRLINNCINSGMCTAAHQMTSQ